MFAEGVAKGERVQGRAHRDHSESIQPGEHERNEPRLWGVLGRDRPLHSCVATESGRREDQQQVHGDDHV